MATGVPVSPTTSTGTELEALPVTPSSPDALSPQHFTPAPAPTIAQVCAKPALTAVAPLPDASATTGTVLSCVLPLPSWPCSLAPQHTTPPAVVTAQACASPLAMLCTLQHCPGPHSTNPTLHENSQVCAAPQRG